MQKQKLFKKLSFFMALVMTALSICTPVMAKPGAEESVTVSAAEGEEPGILKGAEIGIQYVDKRTGFIYELDRIDPDNEFSDWIAVIIGLEDTESEYNDPVIPDKVYCEEDPTSIPYYVMGIDSSALANCKNMKGTLSIKGYGKPITGGDPITIYVMDNAFQNCTGLTGLNIGKYVKIYQDKTDFAFSGCSINEITYTSEDNTALDLTLFNGKAWYDRDNNTYEEIIEGTVYKDPRAEYKVEFLDWYYDEEGEMVWDTISSNIVLDEHEAEEPVDLLGDTDYYKFAGWFKDEECKEKYNFNTPVTGDLKLYAGWNEVTYEDGILIDVMTHENKESDEPDIWFTVNEDGKTATLVKNKEDDAKSKGIIEPFINKNLAIPEEVRDIRGKIYKVTQIGDQAFYNLSRRYAGSLIIPEGIERIGAGAFEDYTQLTGELTIPSSVTAIGANAFSGCAGFAGPLSFGGDASKLTSLGSGAFSGCAGLTGTLAFPKGITSISDSAFSGCAGLTGTLTVPGSITAIGDSAFANCTGFTGLQLNEGLTKIGASAFTGDKFAGQLKLPNTVEDIGDSAFEECKGFTSLILGTGVKYISLKAFRNCTGFTGVLTIPNGVLAIGPNAFDGCKGFTGDLIIPDSVEYLNGGAFFGCAGFGPWLVVGSGITEFGDRSDMNGNDDVFSGCTGIKAINNKMAKFSINVKDMLPAGGDLVWREGSKNGTPLIAGAGLQAGKMGYRSDYTGEEKAPEIVEDPNSLSGNNAPMDYTQVEKASGEIKMVITYPKKIPFFGKSKLKPSDLGENFTVSVNGKVYKVSKIKINKKNKTIQIIKLEGVTDKAINKAIKKETKGDKGLVFEISKFNVGSSTEVTPKIKTKKGVTTLKSVKVKVFGGKPYKAKKGEARLSDDGKYIEFSGDNLEGRRLLN